MAELTADRLLEAIDAIEKDTGYAPTPDELNAVLGLRRIQSTGAWRSLMAAGRIHYDADGRVTLRA